MVGGGLKVMAFLVIRFPWDEVVFLDVPDYLFPNRFPFDYLGIDMLLLVLWISLEDCCCFYNEVRFVELEPANYYFLDTLILLAGGLAAFLLLRASIWICKKFFWFLDVLLR